MSDSHMVKFRPYFHFKRFFCFDGIISLLYRKSVSKSIYGLFKCIIKKESRPSSFEGLPLHKISHTRTNLFCSLQNYQLE